MPEVTNRDQFGDTQQINPNPNLQRAYKKNQQSKTMDFINTGLSPQVLHDIDNKAHIVEPGGSLRIEMHAGVAEKLERASDRNGTLQTGARARQFLDRQRFEQEMQEKEANMRQQHEREVQELQTRQTRGDKNRRARVGETEQTQEAEKQE